MFWLYSAFLLAAATAIVVDDATLDLALESPKELGKMFTAFELENHRGSSAEERSMRFQAFKKHVKEISVHNHGGYSWHEGLNYFADMSDEERMSHTGLNLTNVVRNVVRLEKREEEGRDTPSSQSWIKEGAVTPVKDQGGCGSCWSFGAMGTLEGVYKLETGVLRNFAEQQMLDCTYDHDGCGGGWMRDGVLSVRTAGQLASTADYPYVAYDGSCKAASKRNSMVGADVVDYVELEEGEAYTINALAQRPLTVTICVIDSFFSYTSGIYRDDTYTSFPNHALTAVAYTSQYILVKNSWAQTWGDRGFIKIARNYNGCSFHRFVGYAVLGDIRTDNNESDEVTDYDPEDGDEPGPDPSCRDTDFTGCKKVFCDYTLVRERCQKTCGDCEGGDDDGECPSGTILCDDGVCRHEHMCPH